MALSTSSPSVQVCILGGGIGGCAALKSLSDTTSPSSTIALIEMGRGLGGRTSTRFSRDDDRIQINHGAPTADVRTENGLSVFQSLEARGFAKEIKSQQSETARYFVGHPNMSSLCQGLVSNLSLNPNYLFQTMVRGIEPSISNGKVDSWTLKDKNGEIMLTTEWLVVSGSGVAHPRWTAAFGGVPPLVQAAETINNKVLDGALQFIEDIGAKPIQVAMMAFDNDETWKSFPDDTSIIETPDDQVLEKLVFQKSSDGGLVSLVAHSTTEFALTASDVYGSKSTAARVGGASSSTDREEEVLGALMASVDVQLKELTCKDDCVLPSWGPFLHRWGNAFPSGSALKLNQAVIGDAKIAFCGDYVGERFGSIEGALLSGMHVGQIVGRKIKSS